MVTICIAFVKNQKHNKQLVVQIETRSGCCGEIKGRRLSCWLDVIWLPCPAIGDLGEVSPCYSTKRSTRVEQELSAENDAAM